MVYVTSSPGATTNDEDEGEMFEAEETKTPFKLGWRRIVSAILSTLVVGSFLVGVPLAVPLGQGPFNKTGM